MKRNIDLILKSLKTGLKDIYRNRMRNLFLFGSYARGEEKNDSDVDIALVIDDYEDVGKEIETTGDLISRLSLANNIVISLHPIREKDWRVRKVPLILNLKKEGVAI